MAYHVSIAYAALRCRCPRCGRGALYHRWFGVALVEWCSECGLPLKRNEQGDGPAFFAVLIIGGLAAMGAAIVEIKYEPPFWVHAALWGPFILLGAVWALRVSKAALLAAHYQYRPQDFAGE